MKSLYSLAIVAVVLASPVVKASPLVIYGEDNRVEVLEANKLWQNKARAVAIQVPVVEMGISKILGGRKLGSRTFRQANTSEDKESGQVITLCGDPKFADQPNPGNCTGFLVAPDLLVTAGHCVRDQQACLDGEWIFDFQTDINGKVDLDIPADRVYSCKRIIRSMLPDESGMDFSLIQLDRPTIDRPSLDINIAEKVGMNDKVLMIGSPLGLPLKISPDAHVRYDEEVSFFSTNLDSFLGNSGSPVFNQRTGKVEGILVAGEEDFKGNMEKMCVEVNQCKDDECRGEDVSRLITIPELAFRESLQKIARDGDIEQLKTIKKMGIDFFVDIYGARMVTPLMTALDKNQLEVAELLLQMKADPNHKSLTGVKPVEILIANYHKKADFEFALDLLLKHGADIGYRNANIETLLFAAVRANNQGAVEVLLAKGLDAKAKNLQGKNARDIAKEMKLKPIRKVLFQAMYGKGLKGLLNSIFKKKTV